jgi:general secretion pathway protein L
MARRILGIDLGATSVKGVLLESAYRGFTVVDAASQPLPELPAPAGPEGAEAPPPPPLRERQVAALRDLVAGRGWSFEASVVALPGAAASTHLVTLPFSDPKRIEQTIGFEVESQIPFDLDEVAWDWQVVGHRGAQADVLVSVVRHGEVAALLQALSTIGVDPLAVVPPGPAHAPLFGSGVLEGDEPLAGATVDVLVDVGAARTSLCVVSQHGLEWARSVALGAADLARAGVGPLARELRATLKALRARAPEPHPVRRLLLAGEGARLEGLADALSPDVDAPVVPLALAGPAAAIPPADAPHVALALAAALRGHLGPRAPRLNLRRRDLAYTRDFQHVRGKVVRLAAWTGAIVALALVSTGVKAFARARQEKLLDGALCDATQQIVGKCFDDFSVAESVLRGRGTPAAAIPKVSAADVLAELAQRAPADVPLRLDRIEIARDTLHLQGTTEQAENVDRIVTALRGSRCFGDARSGGARRRGGADAKFEFTIDSDLTCETGAPAAVGGRAP